MDKGEYENELKQVIGDTKAAYDISEHDTLIFGAYGLLVAGPNSRHHEPLLCAYLQFITIDIFVQNYFARMWILNGDMQMTEKIIDNAAEEPTALERIRYRICRLAKDIIQLEEILGFLLEALDVIEIPPEPPEQAGRSLYERLEISGMRAQLLRRTNDLKKNIGGSSRYLEVLREQTHVVSEKKMFFLNEALELNTKKLIELDESSQKTSHSMVILHFVFAGMLAFDILDRITGEWTVVNTSWMQDLAQMIKEVTAMWFFVSLVAWAVVAYVLSAWFERMNNRAGGLMSVRIKYHTKIFRARLEELIATKQPRVHAEERYSTGENEICRITYIEPEKDDWGGTRPRIVIEYDDTNSYLLFVTIQYNPRQAKRDLAFTSKELRKKLTQEFDQFNLWDDVGEDHSHQDLATDKRARLNERLLAEAEDDADEMGDE